MSEPLHDPAPSEVEPPSLLEEDPPDQDVERAGIQIDENKIKARIQPTDTGEPRPQTWGEVKSAVHLKLMAIAVNFVGVLDDFLDGARRFIRGISAIPAAAARQIERAHDKGDRAEAVRQEKLESGALPVPKLAQTVDQLEDLLAKLQADGAAVEIRDLGDGRQAIVIVKPENLPIIDKLIAKALPPPGATSSAKPKRRRKAEKGGAELSEGKKRPQRKKPEPGPQE